MNSSKSHKTALIIGAGPAGLTAAYELLTRTDIQPIVFEADLEYVGGISRTVRYNGNRIDIGGHRFFSKSDRVMNWWLSILPVEKNAAESLTYQGSKAEFNVGGTANPDTEDDILLVRQRSSRIYHNGKFFTYPITLSLDTLKKLGFVKLCKIGITYFFRKCFPRKPEVSLEDFFINRFGDELYLTFFKSYTEKVWGLPCTELSAEWGAQRVKGLSISAVLLHAIQKPFKKSSLSQKGTETSLIEWFLYPKFGPGQLWEVVAKRVQEKGGILHMGTRVVRVLSKDDRVTGVVIRSQDGVEQTYEGDYVFSTMPINELGKALHAPVEIREISDELPYRDFITVGILLNRAGNVIDDLKDNWIYVHEPAVDVGRIQIFNNWSPYLVADPEHTTWVGLEFFCNQGDHLWNMLDTDLIAQAAEELEKLGLAKKANVKGGTVIRQPKAYNAYTGSYERFPEVRAYLDSIPNLFPIGRNGMHRYNNQDHSMLVAMAAVDNILAGREDKANLWAVNAEKEYHEEK